ncbi:cobalamin biosynthesis protein [uncultured Rhodoferax sp.]|uniref:cobalamin biosynthesis protein n=1 Tax=uncultured Rhodoferax sp. TaxID=223188 RepID=UPI0025E74C5F|nr:cobalamin biosynthesis protein [uncultured Rhodoferax sp.]
MSVAGFGFRAAATADSLRRALHAALVQSDVPVTLTALATAWDKANTPAFVRFAAESGLPVLAIPAEALHTQPAHTSAHVPARYGRHSLAEAAALAAAGTGAQLRGPRCVSPDRLATAAIAFVLPENTFP